MAAQDDNENGREEIQKLVEEHKDSLGSIINVIFNPTVLTEALTIWATLQMEAAGIKGGTPQPVGFSIPIGGGKSVRFQGTASLE